MSDSFINDCDQLTKLRILGTYVCPKLLSHILHKLIFVCWVFIKIFSFIRKLLTTSNFVCSNSLFRYLKCVDSPMLTIMMNMSKKFHTKVANTFIKLIKNANQTEIRSSDVIKYGTLLFTSSVNGSFPGSHFITKWSTDPSLNECSTGNSERFMDSNELNWIECSNHLSVVHYK